MYYSCLMSLFPPYLRIFILPHPLLPPLPLPSTLQLHAKIRWSLIDEPADENSDDDDKTIWCIRLAVFVEPKETELLKYEEPSFRVVP